jgi:guanylate kinase
MLITLTGPSGIGKGFIKEKLLQVYPFIEELVWFTTRGLRPNEQKSNRMSVSKEEFNELVISNELVLVQNDLFGHSYGIKKKDLLPSSCIKLTEIHVDNIKQAFEINPTILAIGLITRDFSIIQNRLSVIRKSEGLVEIEKRIISAKIEVESILSSKDLFTSIIEVNKVSESNILEQIISVLINNLKEKEDKLCF